MIGEIGQFSLILALMVALTQCALPFASSSDQRLSQRLTFRLANAQFALIAVSYVMLTWAFLAQDFSIRYVAVNSNSLLPIVYRFSAVWGAHEGSLLLWLLILSGWGAALAWAGRAWSPRFHTVSMATMAAVSIGFLLFTILTSNPFERLLPAAIEGRDLNPLLQDPGLIIHPPMLYFGYVGFAVPFAIAIAALIEQPQGTQWVSRMRSWTLTAWAFLTIGIALGSWWAYYELGWGGWWFWDPVENASFMPWLAGVALLHSQAVSIKRGAFMSWTVLLAIAAFSLSLLGTFLVRSGVLTSVHAFATDPERGLFILIYLAVVIGGSLSLYAWRGGFKDEARFTMVSRESLILVNNLFFVVSTIMVLLGTLYPLISEAMGWGQVSVGPPYFGLLFVLLMAPVIAFLPLGPMARWMRASGQDFAGLIAALVGTLLVAAGALMFGLPLKAAVGLAAATWLLVGTGVWARHAIKKTGQLPVLSLGMLCAHVGVGVFVAGVLVTESMSVQRDIRLAPGQVVEVAGYQFTMERVEAVDGPNYRADQATVRVSDEGGMVALLRPQKRRYASGGQVMTEAAIDAGLLRDVYVSMGEPLDDGTAWAMRVYVKPLVRLIWLGALMMALGGFVAAFARRRARVTAPAKLASNEVAA